MNKSVDVVLSSPYKRAVDTVKDFADRARLAIGIVPDFRERKVESVWIDDFEGFCKQQWADFTYKLSDGESLGEVQERNITALREVLTVHKNQTNVIGTHGTALATILNYYDPSFGYDGFQRIRHFMPWILRMSFDGERLIEVVEHDVFEGADLKGKTMVYLREITKENINAVLELKTTKEQEAYVSTVAHSLAQAWVYRDTAYPFAVYNDDMLVGFVMMGFYEAKQQYTLWKLLIDERYQHRGYGRQAVEFAKRYLIDTFGVTEVYLGVHEDNAVAIRLYQSAGFVATGETDGNQIEMKWMI